MLRLAHRLITQPTSLPNISTKEKLGLAEQRCRLDVQLLRLPQCRVIVADNVAEFYASAGPDRQWNEKDFPNLVPPFPVFFVEANIPHEARWKFEAIPNLTQLGVVVRALSPSDIEGWPQLHEWHREFASQSEWVLALSAYMSFKHVTCPVCPGFNAFVSVRKDGYPLGTAVSGGLFDTDTESYCGRWPYHIAFLAISFMHCKNVKSVDATESHGPSAKWLRRTRSPGIRYSTLEIEPMKEVLRAEGGLGGNGLKKALHICRGHFATYTDDKPLFGRVTGTFWKPQHVRGSKEHGEVVKEYEVNAPA